VLVPVLLLWDDELDPLSQLCTFSIRVWSRWSIVCRSAIFLSAFLQYASVLVVVHACSYAILACTFVSSCWSFASTFWANATHCCEEPLAPPRQFLAKRRPTRRSRSWRIWSRSRAASPRPA
jgi:hypothetical protein